MSLNELCDAFPSMSLDQHPSLDSTSKEQRLLTVRALISAVEADTIIASESYADIIGQTGSFMYISRDNPNLPHRVLMVSGPTDDVLEVCAVINKLRISAPSLHSHKPSPTNASIRLLVPTQFMPVIIGFKDCKIEEIKNAAGVVINAEWENLPQSTERIVEVVGTLEGIGIAIKEISRCLPEEWQLRQDTVLYDPFKLRSNYAPVKYRKNGRVKIKTIHRPKTRTKENGEPLKPGKEIRYLPRGKRNKVQAAPAVQPSLSLLASQSDPLGPPVMSNYQTQSVPIPCELVGCIMGHDGNGLGEIEYLSGASITIAAEPQDSDEEECIFRIWGAPGAIEDALNLICQQLVQEKERRSRGESPT